MAQQGTVLMDVVIAGVEQNGWSYTRRDDNVILFPVAGRQASYDAVVMTHEGMQYVTTYCSIATRAPGDRRVAVAEAITRANFGLPVGGFELDFEDGEVRFRVGIDVEGGSFAPVMMQNMLGLSVAMCDRYHDALMRVMFADMEPAAAIALAEQA